MRKQHGIGLLEVVLAISVMAVLIIISVNYYSNVRSEQKINYFINQISHISTGIANYINSNPGADLSKVFSSTSTDLSSQLVSNNIIKQSDIQSLWFPGTQNHYQIIVSPNAYLTDQYGPCLKIQIVLTIPSDARGVVIKNAIQTRLYAAFLHPTLAGDKASSLSNVYFFPTQNAPGKGQTMRFEFCAE